MVRTCFFPFSCFLVLASRFSSKKKGGGGKASKGMRPAAALSRRVAGRLV